MTSILIAVVVLLVIVAVALIIRVSDLSAKARDKDINDVTQNDNNTQAVLFFLIGGVIYLALVLWQFKNWGVHILPPASSEHGAIIDGLMNFTLGLIIFVFFITQPMLVWFVFKYRRKKGKAALYYPHNNKLELIWTVLPSLALTAVILYGLNTWIKITNADVSDATVVEVYSKQFSWVARYSGEDNLLGSANYKLVEGRNALGVDMEDASAADDFIAREVHIPVNKPVLLKFRSQDVIHSAYLPHFRVQMNCVPGMTTQFAFTPTQTTAEMKEQEGEDFDFILMCNKICGVAHFNMQMKFVVDTEADYNAWVASQKTLENTLTLR